MTAVLQRAIDPLYLTAWTFVGLWAAGMCLLLAGRPARWVMASGVGIHLLHVWLAFDRLGGTHADVAAHTARNAGVGWGVYVNYLFATVWMADTVWLTAATRSYARRPRWLGYAVHGFLAFVVFNATVVYGEPATRLAGVVWFAILVFSWWRAARARRASEGESRPGSGPVLAPGGSRPR